MAFGEQLLFAVLLYGLYRDFLGRAFFQGDLSFCRLKTFGVGIAFLACPGGVEGKALCDDLLLAADDAVCTYLNLIVGFGAYPLLPNPGYGKAGLCAAFAALYQRHLTAALSGVDVVALCLAYLAPCDVQLSAGGDDFGLGVELYGVLRKIGFGQRGSVELVRIIRVAWVTRVVWIVRVIRVIWVVRLVRIVRVIWVVRVIRIRDV